jgi:hypothetical protein
VKPVWIFEFTLAKNWKKDVYLMIEYFETYGSLIDLQLKKIFAQYQMVRSYLLVVLSFLPLIS